MALNDQEEAALREQLKKTEADVDKWKGLSRKHEDQAKENADAVKELEQLKQSSLSDQQRREAADKAATDKLAEFEKQLGEERAARMRAEVAAAKGLTPGQAKRLNGATLEELEADADDILENFKSTDTGDGSDKDKTRPATRPKLSVSGGGDPTDNAAVETDPAKLAANLPRF